MSDYNCSKLKSFDVDKELFEQDFEQEICNDENFVPFPCVKIETMAQLHSLFDKIFELEKQGREFFYRGQYNAEWLLETTLERAIKSKNTSMYLVINAVFKDFTKNLRGILSDQSLLNQMNNEEGCREIWAIGRHYDLKTPYLDWTKSVYVALFMAYAEPENFCDYSAVFVVDGGYFQEFHGLVESYWFTPKTDYYGRITAQKGFLSEYKIRDDIKQRLKNNQKCAIKVYVNNQLKKEILEYLNHIGINYATMYPDLLGVVKYANNQLAEHLSSCGEK